MPGRNHSEYISPGYDGDYRGGRITDAGPSHYNGDGRAADNRLRRAGQPSAHTEANGSGEGHVYSVDHLVTWSVGPEHGVLTHQDGMRQLSKMEQQTGVFTMRCILTVEDRTVQIVDSQTGDMMEQFPLECIRDPVAVKDRNGMFNNIALFTVVEDPKKKHSPSEMHIFQIAGRPARELADDLAQATLVINSTSNRGSSSLAGSAPRTPQHADSYGNLHQPRVKDVINHLELKGHQEQDELAKAAMRPREQLRATRRMVESEGDSEDDVKMGVTVLNKCFDDVERFVLRLKNSAKALQELLNRKQNSKSRKHGEGMLTMRSRAPSPAEFAECFQKIKLSFNLLARLKSYLHNPNSTELVHFLFTPLSLLVEASNDPRFDIHDLVRKVVTPLLNRQAVELLEHCLTSKEYDFWMSLGEAWRTPRSKWNRGQIQEFRPKFSDGFQPTEAWLESFLGNTIANLVAKQAIDRRSREVEEEPAQHYNGVSNGRNGHDAADGRQGRRSSDHLRSPVSPHSDFPSPTRPSDIALYTDRSNGNADTEGNRHTPWDAYQKSYLRDLQQRHAKIYEVVQDRKGNNSKELTIRKGEIVEVLEDVRNWWRCANINGDQGFVPYTLLKYYVEGSLPSPNSDNYLPATNTAPPLAPAAPVNRYIPPPPPPPPPPALPPPSAIDSSNWKLRKPPASASSKADAKKKADEIAASRRSDEFSNELKQRLSRINVSESNGGGRRLSSSLSAQVFIDQHSTVDEVTDWLQRKGFKEHTVRMLTGYTGSELFHISTDALMSEFGQQEGSRLVSQLKLMKTTAGYTQSGSSQLRKILERRKQRAENEEERESQRGSQGSDGTFEDSDEFPSASMVRTNQPDASRRY